MKLAMGDGPRASTVLRFSALVGGLLLPASSCWGERWGSSPWGSFLVRETKLSKLSGPQDRPPVAAVGPSQFLLLLFSCQSRLSFLSHWSSALFSPHENYVWRITKTRHCPNMAPHGNEFQNGDIFLKLSSASPGIPLLVRDVGFLLHRQCVPWKEEAWAVMKPHQLSTPPEATYQKMQGCQLSSQMFAS